MLPEAVQNSCQISPKDSTKYLPAFDGGQCKNVTNMFRIDCKALPNDSAAPFQTPVQHRYQFSVEESEFFLKTSHPARGFRKQSLLLQQHLSSLLSSPVLLHGLVSSHCTAQARLGVRGWQRGLPAAGPVRLSPSPWSSECP